MRSKNLLPAVFITANFAAFSQAPGIEWQKCFGGTYYDYASSLVRSNVNGYVVAGSTRSSDTLIQNHGGSDCLVFSLDSNANIQWVKSLGGTNDEYGSSIVQTKDNGYILTGGSRSSDGDASNNYGDNDCWVVKIDSMGNLSWEKSYGGSSRDNARSIVQANDGGFVVVGSTVSNDIDVTGNHGTADYWIFKIDTAGIIQWQKCLGGNEGEEAWAMVQTTDGGYALAGGSESNDGDVSGNHGGEDYWIVNLDSSGNIQWQKSFGGSADETPYSLIQTIDDGYAIAGRSRSNDGDVIGNHGGYDYWIVKLDSFGILQWQKSLGGSNEDQAYSIIQSADSGYIVIGNSASLDGNVTGNHGNADYWVVKLSSIGELQWERSYGGSYEEQASCIIQSANGGYVAVGETVSNDGDVNGNSSTYGTSDCWIVKLGPDTVNAIQEFDHKAFLSVFPNPSTGVFEIKNSSLPIENSDAFNLLGEKVFFTSNVEHSTSGKIDLFSQPDGVYFLHVNTEEGMVVKKVVISR